MNARFLPAFGVVLLAFVSPEVLHSQVVPSTPTKFSTRITGGGTNGSASIGMTPKAPTDTTVRTVTYVALSDSRQWKSTDGKSLIGKLIAFEDLVVETKIAAGAKPEPGPLPAMPEKPTVIRDSKARLLVDNKPYEVPLTRLGDDERKFIENLQAAVNAKAKAKP